MLRVAVAPCSPFSVSGELMRDAADLARRAGVRLHTHLAETTDEADWCLERFGCTPLEYAEQLCRHFIERKARIAGVREAFVRHRLEPDPRWLRVGDPADARFVRSLTAARQADALLCANDHTAALLLRSLETAGVKVPRDVRVVGFDDAKYATLVSPPLTTIHQPCRDIALIALRAMLERIAEPTLPARGSALTPRLVVRESCGAYLPRGTNRSRMSPFWDSTGN